MTNEDNPSEGLYDNWAGITLGAEDDAATNACPGQRSTGPDNDMSVTCANAPGLVETSNDGSGMGSTAGQQTIFAAYPRQPFDIAGRTGMATFSVTDDTEGGHGSWPTWVYTSTPTPAPAATEPPGPCTPLSANCGSAADTAQYSIGSTCPAPASAPATRG